MEVTCLVTFKIDNFNFVFFTFLPPLGDLRVELELSNSIKAQIQFLTLLFYMSNSLSVLSYFDGNNSSYWKIRRRAFSKSMDARIWLYLVNGWIAPSSTINGVVTLLQ